MHTPNSLSCVLGRPQPLVVQLACYWQAALRIWSFVVMHCSTVMSRCSKLACSMLITPRFLAHHCSLSWSRALGVSSSSGPASAQPAAEQHEVASVVELGLELRDAAHQQAPRSRRRQHTACASSCRSPWPSCAPLT